MTVLHRRLHGWSPHGVTTFTTALVTSPQEMDQARQELASGEPTSYVMAADTSATLA